MNNIEKSYELAAIAYKDLGVDVETSLERLDSVNISIQCWQGDDVRGFEKRGSALGGGLMATGNYPGKARTPSELRADLKQALRLIPGKHRVNLHASYGEFNRDIDRDEIEPEHYRGWIDWAKNTGVKLDFNATLFSHPMADSGFTLSSKESAIRRFWVNHVKRSREAAVYIGSAQGTPCIHNLWIPDGMKDQCIDKWGYRKLLVESLDEIFSVKYSPKVIKDSLESKLFGLGSESFVVGSHDFYLSYAISRGLMVCLDLGHYHPTESVADKLSALLQFMPEVLVHISRGVRWDSDHVPVQDDQLRELVAEIVRSGSFEKVGLALDYFDASINRVGAWVTGARSTWKTILYAFLEPVERLRELEEAEDYIGRLVLLEELKGMPWGAVWDCYCLRKGVPVGGSWLDEIQHYEKTVLNKR